MECVKYFMEDDPIFFWFCEGVFNICYAADVVVKQLSLRNNG